MIELVPRDLYNPVFYWVMFSFCIITCFLYWSSQGCEKLLKKKSAVFPFLYAVILIIYIGLRPSSWRFGDMGMYRHLWNVIDISSFDNFFDFNSEWFFIFVLKICKILVPNVQFWFLFVELIYIGCQFWACKKLLWENVWLAILFVFFSYSFYSYGTNGIRNGMGCAIMMLAISYFCDRTQNSTFVGFVLFILAYGCHRSMIIPMSALLVSLYVIKDIKTSVVIWLGCIFVSIFAGNAFIGFFERLGFDNRMSEYAHASEAIMSSFSRTGFRWDFLLYSAMPVWLAWYVSSKGIQDKTFTLLANTYIIANSFWVLICRVAFSNRFAYMSWFMYALVIAYAVIRVPIWQNQDNKAGKILFAHTAFTIIMFVLGK